MISRERPEEPANKGSRKARKPEPTEGLDSLRAAHRVIALLNRDQVDFLDKLGKDAQFSSGTKLTRTQILAAMVNALKHLDLNGDGIRNARQFEQRLVDAIERRRFNGKPNDGISSEEEQG